MSRLVGIDVGGTFTDYVSVDPATSSMTILKVPTTLDGPERGVIDALGAGSANPRSIERLAHGTTVSTNAILERTGASVGLITTAGFEDVLEIGRSDRAHLYDLSWRKPAPLVPRELRFGVAQRTDGFGRERVPLDVDAVRRAALRLVEAGAESVAVCFLHAYANSSHEEQAREVVASVAPSLVVSISSEVMNSVREFERTSTVVVDAYVKPVMSRYLHRLEGGLAEAGVQTQLQVMQSSGGVMTSQHCAALPVHTLLSGPAAGVIAAQDLAARSGYSNVITLDIGGTSADVAVITGGRPTMTTDTEVDWGIPVQVPMIDIRTIGAGGGSIARIDRGGRLKVGPGSAGARPGPACFGLGGDLPTVTDANLVLGYLSTDGYADGEFPLDIELAAKSLAKHLGAAFGSDVRRAARGVLDIVDANMRNLIRQVTVQRGHDPRDFALMAFGGGGPVHAASVARELGIGTVLVPQTPGVLSAYGLVLAEPRYDFVQSFARRLGALRWSELTSLVAELEARGRALLAGTGVVEGIEVSVSLDMQFERQNYTIEVPLDSGVSDPVSLRAAYDRTYEQMFGTRMDGQPVSIVNCRVSVTARSGLDGADARLAEPQLPQLSSEGKARPVRFDAGSEPVDCPLIDRRSLTATDALPSPCIIEQPDTSVVIPPGVTAAVDGCGLIVIDLASSGSEVPC